MGLEPMASLKITYVQDTQSGDWEGWYIDGKLADEDHDVSATRVLDLLKIPYDYVEAVVAPGDRLPRHLTAVTTKAQAEAAEKRRQAERLRNQALELETEARRLEAGES